MSLIILLVLSGAQLLSLIPGVTAQMSNATCISSYSWADNSRGQSPCTVASFLQGTCADGVFTVRALPPGRHYAGPTSDLANPCYCSTVVYSLIAACGDCQGAMFEDWTDWRANCTTVSNSKFPIDIPPGTSVPHWAYLDVVTGDRYDPIRAQQDATASTVESTRTAFSTSSPTVTRHASAKSRTKIAPIVGGVVGGLIFLALVGALVFFLIVRRRQTKTAPSATYGDGSQSGLASPPPMSQPTPVYPAPASFGGYPSEMTGSPSPKIYDPSDPSTFPTHAGAPQRQSGYVTSFEPPSPGPDYTHANAVPLAYNYQPPFEPQSPGTPEYAQHGNPYNRYHGAPEL